MNQVAGAILLGALIIAASIWLRPESEIGRYSMQTESRWGSSFRLDTQTGEIVVCPPGNNECRIAAKAEAKLSDLDRDLRNGFAPD